MNVYVRGPACRLLRGEGPIVALLIIYNYRTVCVGDEEEGGGRWDPAYRCTR